MAHYVFFFFHFHMHGSATQSYLMLIWGSTVCCIEPRRREAFEKESTRREYMRKENGERLQSWQMDRIQGYRYGVIMQKVSMEFHKNNRKNAQ